jgi:TPR repeat protein
MDWFRTLVMAGVCVAALSPGALFAQTPQQAPQQSEITLLNGRRLCPNGVDLNTIPAAALAGVEVLKDGYGAPPGLRRPMAELQKEAQAGNVAAMLAIGGKYRGGIDTPRNDGKAAEWFIRAKDAGSVAAMNELAAMYVWGEGVAKDVRLGRQYRDRVYELSSDGQYGDLPAWTFGHSGPATIYAEGPRMPFIRLGAYLLDGPDPAPIIAAAEAGNLDAMQVLAQIYVAGEYYWGLPSSEAESTRWAMRCADAGRIDCLSHMAFWKQRGFNFQGAKDPHGAIALYIRMAEMGSVDAMDEIARVYAYGDHEGVGNNPAEAERWIVRAMEAGSKEARENLGNWKLEGRVPLDPAGGFKILSDIAGDDMSDIRLVRNILAAYDKGAGDPADPRLPGWRAVIARLDADRAARTAKWEADCKAAKPN